MPSTFWIAIAAIAIVSVVCRTLVKMTGNNRGSKRTRELEADLGKLESDLEDALERIVVLEKIVTDGKHNLRREIDDLAS